MHWIAFIILVLTAAVFQAAVVPFVSVHTIRPDLMVIVAVHYALSARGQDALLACWVIGLVVDLTSLSFNGAPNVGLHALSLGLIAVVVVKLRDLTFRDSVVTRLFFTFTIKLVLSLLAGVYMLYVLETPVGFGDILIIGLYSAVYTAVLAPYGHWLLRQLRSPLGIGTTHRLHVR